MSSLRSSTAPRRMSVISGAPRVSDEIFVPFGGGEHDWAALELAAWLAAAAGNRIVLVGTGSDRQSGRRDASRLLADAAVAAQRLAGSPLVRCSRPHRRRACATPWSRPAS